MAYKQKIDADRLKALSTNYRYSTKNSNSGIIEREPPHRASMTPADVSGDDGPVSSQVD